MKVTAAPMPAFLAPGTASSGSPDDLEPFEGLLDAAEGPHAKPGRRADLAVPAPDAPLPVANPLLPATAHPDVVAAGPIPNGAPATSAVVADPFIATEPRLPDVPSHPVALPAGARAALPAAPVPASAAPPPYRARIDRPADVAPLPTPVATASLEAPVPVLAVAPTAEPRPRSPKAGRSEPAVRIGEGPSMRPDSRASVAEAPLLPPPPALAAELAGEQSPERTANETGTQETVPASPPAIDPIQADPAEAVAAVDVTVTADAQLDILFAVATEGARAAIAAGTEGLAAELGALAARVEAIRVEVGAAPAPDGGAATASGQQPHERQGERPRQEETAPRLARPFETQPSALRPAHAGDDGGKVDLYA